MKCWFKRLNAVLEQECEITFNIAVENYNEDLKQHFINRSEPFDVPTLFQILKNSRDVAIDDFAIVGEVREKYRNYEDFLNRLQTFINTQEAKIIDINENLADELIYKFKPTIGL